MLRLSREDAARLCRHWVEESTNVYKGKLYEIHHKLEEGLAGRFPPVMPPAAAFVPLSSGGEATPALVDDQIEPNLLLWALNFMDGMIFDEFPSLRWSREPSIPENVVVASERMIEMFLDRGDAMAECRIALRYMMSRGPFIVWPIVNRVTATPEEVRASKVNPEDYVVAARAGTLEKIPPGSDFFAISTVMWDWLESPEKRLGLRPDEVARIEHWATEADVKHAAALNMAHRRPTGRLAYECTPYGSKCLWDNTTTEVRNARWMDHILFFDPDEFREDPAFTDEAKNALQPVAYDEALGNALSKSPAASQESDKALEETGCIKVHRIFDRKRWKVLHYADGFDKTIGVDDSYPYLDEEGKPIFEDFFPAVVRVPMKHVREDGATSVGIPYLWPGWGHQIETIQFETAASRAAKRSGRIGVANGNATEEDLRAWTNATDGGVVKSKTVGPDQKLFEVLNMGPFPVEYLQAALRAKANFCSSVYLSLAALTGEPVADTLGQEEIAVSGGAMIRTGVMNTVASGIAELAKKSFLLFRAFASDGEAVGYLGAQNAAMWSAIKAAPLDGRKLICTLASSSRTAALAVNKQHMDFFALSQGPLGRDSTGIPYFDPKSQLERLAKDMDIEGLVPYTPSPAEVVAAALTKAMGTQNGSSPTNNGAPKNGAASGQGDTSGRKGGPPGANRGAPAVAGAQARGRGLSGNSNDTGGVMRPVTAR